MIEGLRRCADDEVICASQSDCRCHADGVDIDTDDFCQDKLMLAAADMIESMSNMIDEFSIENERIRQNSVSHETYKLAVDDLKSVLKITQDEMERVGRERDANAVQRDEYREKYVSAEYDLRQLTRERDTLEYDRDAENEGETQ
ncbi:MAG: hypothetical protein RSC06_15015 [Clostridia bacterium]